MEYIKQGGTVGVDRMIPFLFKPVPPPYEFNMETLLE
jgi:hypothetical protein